MSSFTNESIDTVGTSKFPKSPRFFDNSNLPDLRTFQLLKDNKVVSFNSQNTNFNYNPFTFPQSKTKANVPLDYHHLPNRIIVMPPSPQPYSPNDIPCFQLNSQQSLDPIAFIESVSALGRRSGAIKIRLPPEDTELFQNTIQINSDLFWFQTNKLLNNPSSDELTMRLKFHQDLFKFHQSEHSEFIKIEEPADSKKMGVSNSTSVTIPTVAPTSNPTVSTVSGSPAAPSANSASMFYLNKLPMIDKRPLDLYKLFRSVIIRGGFMEVINKKLWAQIGRELGYKGKIMTSLSSSLKGSYQRILYPFELYLASKKFDYVVKKEEIKTEDESIGNGKRSLEEPDEATLPSKRPNILNPTTEDTITPSAPPLIIGSAKDYKRSIKAKSSKGILLNSPHLVDIKQPNIFSIKQEERKRNRRPNDTTDSPILPQSQLNHAIKTMKTNKASYQDDSRLKSAVKVASIYSLRQFMEKDLKFQEFVIQNNPNQFKNSYGNDSSILDRNMVPYDQFEKIYWKFVSNNQVHDILNNGLELELGQDLSSNVNGSGFVKIGDDLINFKNALNSIHLNTDSSKIVRATTVKSIMQGAQQSYTNSGSSATTTTTTTTTTTIDSGEFNSTGYIDEHFKAALHPWNLHNFPTHQNSLLGALHEQDINNQELTTTNLNIGMTFSTENWHCEDHFTQLANYQFFGGSKRWYFIPESEFDKFENLLVSLNKDKSGEQVDVDELVESMKGGQEEMEYDMLLSSLENKINTENDTRLQHLNPNFQNLISLHNNNFKYNQEVMITPEILAENGIRFTTTIQEPGEFIIKFPKCYSSTISFGFNLSESVNFASKTWLNFSLEGEKWLAKQNLLPNFSIFKLLVNLAQMYDSGQNITFDSEIYSQVGGLYNDLLRTEIDLRNKVRKFKTKEVLIDEKLFMESDMISDDDLHNVFPTRVMLIDTKTKESFIITLENYLKYQQEQTLDWSNITAELQLFYSDDKLKAFSKILNNYSVDYEAWTKNYEELMAENGDISLKTYKTLLNEGEKIYSSIFSVNYLTNSAIRQEKLDDGGRLTLFKNYIKNLRSFITNANLFIEECQNVLSIKHLQRIRNGNDTRRSGSSNGNNSNNNNGPGLTELVQLIDKIPGLNFSCPEIEQLLEFKTEIENFDNATRALLSRRNKSLQEFDDLISLGESFGLEIPSLEFITRIRDRMMWLKVYDLIEKGVDPYAEKKEVFTLDNLTDFFNQGLAILSTSDLELIKKIEVILNQSKLFNSKVSEFLRYEYAENLDLNELTKMAERFSKEKLFISMENYVELSRLHLNAKLITEVKNFNTSVVSDSMKFPYADIKHLQNSMSESGLKFDVTLLTNILTGTEEWVSKTYQTFDRIKLVTTLSKDVDLEHLNPKLSMNSKLIEKLYQLLYKSEFSLSDDDKYHESSSYTARFGDENSDVSPKFYCICREYEFGTMVECDKCNEWYHVQCVKDTSNPNDDKYKCPTCILIDSVDTKDLFLQSQMSLFEIKTILSQGEGLKVYPTNELTVLKEIITTLDKYHNEYEIKIAEVVNGSTSIDLKLDSLRFILRKLYGCGLFLDDLWEHLLNLIKEFENIWKEAEDNVDLRTNSHSADQPLVANAPETSEVNKDNLSEEPVAKEQSAEVDQQIDENLVPVEVNNDNMEVDPKEQSAELSQSLVEALSETLEVNSKESMDQEPVVLEPAAKVNQELAESDTNNVEVEQNDIAQEPLESAPVAEVNQPLAENETNEESKDSSDQEPAVLDDNIANFEIKLTPNNEDQASGAIPTNPENPIEVEAVESSVNQEEKTMTEEITDDIREDQIPAPIEDSVAEESSSNGQELYSPDKAVNDAQETDNVTTEGDTVVTNNVVTEDLPTEESVNMEIESDNQKFGAIEREIALMEESAKSEIESDNQKSEVEAIEHEIVDSLKGDEPKDTVPLSSDGVVENKAEPIEPLSIEEPEILQSDPENILSKTELEDNLVQDEPGAVVDREESENNKDDFDSERAKKESDLKTERVD
ncbi:Multicopy suppressor of chk1 protein 1 [Spathaspora sp. JA1]|nr:Multicopy suppressor of chk1 protein 1 [Spathaspora sp. JA1]